MSRFRPQRLTQSLEGPWRIAPATAGRGEAEGWPNGLPPQAVVKTGKITSSGRCWYETSTSLNAALLGCKRLWLRIKIDNPSPGMECTVWIDGDRLAKQPVRLLPLAFPLDGTSALDPSVDISHRLVLLIAGGQAPATFKIWIEGCNNPVIHNLKIEPDPDHCRLRVTLSLDRSFGPGPHQLTYAIFDANPGNKRKRKPITSGTLATTGWAAIPFKKFAPWSPENPRLYILEIMVENAKGQRDQASLRFGMRGVSLTDGMFCLNHKPLRLCAAALCPHGDSREICQRLQTLKGAGFNAAWLESGLNPAAWAAAADELGILLVVAPPPALGLAGEAEPGNLDAMLASAREMVDACGNSPAVISWSAELDCGSFALNPAEELMREIRRLDPSRPVVSGLEPYGDCLNGWILPPGSDTLVRGGGIPFLSSRPCDRASLRELARFRPPASPAWAVLKPVGSGVVTASAKKEIPPAWEERCRAGFDALEMPPSIGDFAQFREAGYALQIKTMTGMLSILHCNPHLAGTVVDGRNWEAKEELKNLENLKVANTAGTPVFFAPPLVLHEGEDEDFQIALPRMPVKKDAHFSVSLIPENHTVSVWRGEIKASAGGNTFADITIPGKFLLPGHYQLVLAAEWEEGGISDIAVEVLPASGWNNPDLNLLSLAPAVATGLGFNRKQTSGAQTALLSLENSILAYAPRELAKALARAEAGGTLFFLGTPGDTGRVLHKIGVLQRPFTIHTIGEPRLQKLPASHAPATLYFGRTSALFEDLPSNGLMAAPWAESFPNHTLDASFGRLHAGSFGQECDPPWGATILEVSLGKGKLLLTTFRWLGALGRDPLTEALLAQLIESFPPNQPLAKISRARVSELVAKLESLRAESRLWHVIGPFSLAETAPPRLQSQWEGLTTAALAAEFPPERKIDFDSPLTGSSGGKTLRWRKYYARVSKPDTSGDPPAPLKAIKPASSLNRITTDAIIIAPLLMPKPEAVAYAITVVEAREKKTIGARLATPHPARIFVNGVIQLEFPGGCDRWITLSLRQGKNFVCVKTVGVNAGNLNARAGSVPVPPYQWGLAMEFAD